MSALWHPILMKCFDKRVAQHIKGNIPASLYPQQFAFRTNRSSSALHTTLMFVHFSSVFNKIIPMKLANLAILGFLTNKQTLQTGSHISSTSLGNGVPQGCSHCTPMTAFLAMKRPLLKLKLAPPAS